MIGEPGEGSAATIRPGAGGFSRDLAEQDPYQRSKDQPTIGRGLLRLRPRAVRRLTYPSVML